MCMLSIWHNRNTDSAYSNLLQFVCVATIPRLGELPQKTFMIQSKLSLAIKISLVTYVNNCPSLKTITCNLIAAVWTVCKKQDLCAIVKKADDCQRLRKSSRKAQRSRISGSGWFWAKRRRRQEPTWRRRRWFVGKKPRVWAFWRRRRKGSELFQAWGGTG